MRSTRLPSVFTEARLLKKKEKKKENPLTSTPPGQGVYGGERQGVKGNVHDPEGTQHGRAPGGVEHRLHLHVVSAYRGLQQRLRTGPVGLSLSHRVNNAFRQQEAAIINRPGTDVSPCSGTGEGVVDFVLTPRYPPKWQKTLHISVFNVKSINMPLQCLQMAKDFAHFCFQCQKYDYATTSVL